MPSAQHIYGDSDTNPIQLGYEELGFNLRVSHYNYVSANSKTENSRSTNLANFSLINWLFPSVYACSCIELTEFIETVSELEITSDQTYDSSHGPGVSLKDLFSVTYKDTSESGYERKTLSLQDFLSDASKAQHQVLLFPNQAPDATTVRQFHISYQLSDGESYNFTTPNIKIQP